jgi:hypothetical protein
VKGAGDGYLARCCGGGVDFYRSKSEEVVWYRNISFGVACIVSLALKSFCSDKIRLKSGELRHPHIIFLLDI